MRKLTLNEKIGIKWGIKRKGVPLLYIDLTNIPRLAEIWYMLYGKSIAFWIEPYIRRNNKPVEYICDEYHKYWYKSHRKYRYKYGIS
jgi:hypothetical protein